MSEAVVETIKKRLDAIEREKSVLVLLAVGSRSRAWGFPSTDSDFDVRFVYLHRADWYLSIDLEELSDVIERPIQDSIDLSGWDIRKALRLFRKSNPPTAQPRRTLTEALGVLCHVSKGGQMGDEVSSDLWGSSTILS